MTFEKGDRIKIVYGEREVEGEVVIGSHNNAALMISFDAMLGGHVGVMPVLVHDQERGIYHSIIDGTEVRIQLA